MCFRKLFTGTRVSENFKFRVSGSRNNRKRTALPNLNIALYYYFVKYFLSAWDMHTRLGL